MKSNDFLVVNDIYVKLTLLESLSFINVFVNSKNNFSYSMIGCMSTVVNFK
jgi:hypothetical protein